MKRSELLRRRRRRRILRAVRTGVCIAAAFIVLVAILVLRRVPVEKAYTFSLDQTELDMTVGETAVLQAVLTPVSESKAKRAAKSLERMTTAWESSDYTVASVDQNGNVTAVGPGTTEISVEFNGKNARTCEVQVIALPEQIVLGSTAEELDVGETAQITWTVDPSNADVSDLTFTSSDPAVVTVDGSGVMTAAGKGTAVVTVQTHGVSAEVAVTVRQPVTGVTLSGTELNVAVGHTRTLAATIAPAEEADREITWTSSDPSVVTVDAEGNVYGVKVGTATVTASCGGVTASCEVNSAVVVVLDPGHDFKHGGSHYNGLSEEKMTLVVAKACKEYLESHYSGVVVYLTQSDGTPLDTDLQKDLQARVDFAVNKGASILVSLHFNVSEDHKQSGALVCVSSQPNISESTKKLADAILARISAGTGLENLGYLAKLSTTDFDSNGNALDYYAINRHCAEVGLTGVIVEHCFIDYDVAYCNTDAKLELLGQLDAQGIADYLELPER